MLTTTEAYARFAVKSYKNKPNNFFKRKKKLEIILFYFQFSMHDLWLAKGTLKNLD